MTKKTRKIGLGIMGFADMLLYLGIPYDSDEAWPWPLRSWSWCRPSATRRASGWPRSAALPLFAESVYGTARLSATTRHHHRPTGTMSIIAGVSSGVEPVFAYAINAT
jgi:ribonucleoside-diphosphate reductase alpha chain